MARIKLSSLNGHFTSSFTVGKYLGGGADGKVYRAESKTTGRVYAAKVIVPRTQGRRRRRRRPHEAHINALLARDPHLASSHVVAFAMCYGAYPGPGMPVVLLFEYCELGTLDEYIAARHGRAYRAAHPVDVALVRRVFAQLLRALDFLHQPRPGAGRGPIVHRDVKPANVVVTARCRHGRMHPSSSLPHVKLCDFGGALELELELELHRASATPGHQWSRSPPERPPGADLAAFSRGYAPPELGWPPAASRYDSAEPAYDVYGLGASIFWVIRRITPPTRTKIVAPRGPASEELYPTAFWSVLEGALQRTGRRRWGVRKLLEELKKV